MQTRRLLTTALVAGAVALSGCAGNSVDSSSSASGSSTSPSSAAKGAVRISGQNFTEAEIVADLYAGVLKKAGYQPQVKLVGTRDVYMATFPKSIDVVPEYTGGVVDFLIAKDKGATAPVPTTSDPAQAIQQVQPLLKKAGITLLNPSGANDANAFFVTKDYSQQNNVTKLSDLKGKSLALAAAPDCQGRVDCEGGLNKTYGIDITKIIELQFGSQQVFDSVNNGEVQLGETSSTDGTVDSQGMVLLQDDKKIQPAQNLVPAVSSSFLAAHPDVADPLNTLMSTLTTEELTKLNTLVAVQRQKPEDVAQQWLSDQGLI
jgi:osmoprotectant transport system substrate-binding protein